MKKISSVISLLLLIAICIGVFSGCAKKNTEEKKEPLTLEEAEEILYDWLLENGTLENGYNLCYEDGNYSLHTNYNGNMIVNYIIPDYDGYKVRVQLSLFNETKEVGAFIIVENENSKGTFSCYHYPEKFTLNTPVSFHRENQEPAPQAIRMPDYGVTKAEGDKLVFHVYEHKREEYEAKKKYNEEVEKLIRERENIAKEISHEAIAGILDWLNEKTFLKPADFGYEKYEPK